MPNKIRSTEEIEKHVATLTAEADALEQKANSEEGLTPEETARLEEIVAELKALQEEGSKARSLEGLAEIKSRMSEPVRPAPKLPATYRRNDATITPGEVFSMFIRSKGEDRLTPDDLYRMKRCGVSFGDKLHVPVDWTGLNAKQRTLSKGATPGSNVVWQSYSDQVIEYVSLTSPLLTVLDSETTNDGNVRSYFVEDDTANESTDITDSSGTELAPTIPDKDMNLGVKKIGTKTITSGYQKITMQEARDSYIQLQSSFAKNNGFRHARKMERDVITGTGNGETGVEGLVTAATAVSSVASWTDTVIENFYFGFPMQYRPELVWVTNSTTYGELRVALKDTTGRSLFDTRAQDGIEYDTLKGKRVFVSDYVPADTVLAFVPRFYKLRLVAGQQFDTLKEKFYPHLAYVGLMDFGGGYRGPATACKKIALTA